MGTFAPQAPEDHRLAVRTSILVVDDHRTFAELLALALSGEQDLNCVGTAHSVTQALSMTESLAPDVVVMDVQLGDGDGVAATAELTKRFPDLRVVVLTAFANPALMRRAANAGACALLPKDGALAEMLQALRTALRGGFFVHPRLLRGLVGGNAASSAPLASLTQREHEVLRMLGSGLDAHVIARELGISVSTCRGHVKNLLAKLGAHSQLEAVVIAMQHRLIHVGSTD
jgi:DNA-binding NarL/FixJ family response regulator